jgi:multisubunit Na+/H+ antiporter MnhB subunit
MTVRVGSRATDGRSRRRSRPLTVHLPFALVIAVSVAGLLQIVLYHWRQGAVLLGGALLLAAALRMLLSDEQAGLIAIRRRVIDALLYSGLGVAVLLIALTITGGPFDLG